MSSATLFGIRYIDLIMFAALAVAACYFWWLEHKDIHCPNFDADKKTCNEQGGMAFSHTKPNDTDSCTVLLNKIHKAAGAEQATVKWRRAFIISAGIMAVMWLTVGAIGIIDPKTKLPSWQTFYLSVLVGFAFLLGSYMYYSYHVFGVAERWMRDSLAELEKKGCIKGDGN
jgi:hypothetical protein